MQTFGEKKPPVNEKTDGREMGGDSFYERLKVLSLLLIIAGALNWGLVGLMKFNAVSWLAKTTKIRDLETFVYVSIGFCALFSAFDRDFYLPFLGRAVYPCGSLATKEPAGADTTVAVTVRPNSNVIYWAADASDAVAKNPMVAYNSYENAGVARSDGSGNAVLKFRRPGSYDVPYRGTLSPHVHYRTCSSNGMLGEVKTASL